MRYDTFRDALHEALRREGLAGSMPADETIELASTERRWRIHQHSFQGADPFHFAAAVSFHWNPFESARSYTCEEDLLTELYGRRTGKKERTEPRLVRVDLRLGASLLHGSIAPIPPSKILQPWLRALGGRLEPFLPDQALMAQHALDVYAGRLPLEVQVSIASDGTPTMAGLSMRAFQFVQLPRVLDHPDRRHKEKDPGRQLKTLARRFRDAFQAWSDSVEELAPRISYTPPPDARSTAG